MGRPARHSRPLPGHGRDGPWGGSDSVPGREWGDGPAPSRGLRVVDDGTSVSALARSRYGEGEREDGGRSKGSESGSGSGSPVLVSHRPSPHPQSPYLH